MPKVCIFCGGGGPFSAEHVLPEWTARLIGVRRVQVTSSKLGVRRRPWEAVGSFGHKISSVCRGCNNGWMSGLEEIAKPILSPLIVADRQTRLTTDQQVVVASWVWKVAILHEHVSGATYFTEDERTCLMNGDAPPEDGVRMWVAQYSGERVARLRGGPSTFKAATGHTFEGIVVSLAVRRFAAQIVAVRRKAGEPRGTPKSQFASGDVARRLWPDPGVPIPWPPARASMSDQAFNQWHWQWNTRGIPLPDY